MRFLCKNGFKMRPNILIEFIWSKNRDSNDILINIYMVTEASLIYIFMDFLLLPLRKRSLISV